MIDNLLKARTPEDMHAAYYSLTPEDRERLWDMILTIENPDVRARLRGAIVLAGSVEMFNNAPSGHPPGTVI